MKCDRDIELYVRDEIDLDELEERMDVALGIRRRTSRWPADR
jgi:hypothetical protein